MDMDKILDKARAQAAQAKPGIMKHGGKIYTFVFDPAEWVYQVYADGFEFIRFNTKSVTTAKRYLKQHLES
jgi:hypothetical protein